MSQQLTNDQVYATELIKAWWQNAKPLDKFFLSGAAGTGKTWLIDHMIREYGWTPLVVTPTNKAAQVLQKKGINAITIHSAIYYPPIVSVDESGELELQFDYEGVKFKSNLLIIDEISMVGREVGLDIERGLSEAQLPLLAVGDIHQLPPVKDVRWIGEPDYELTQVVRHDNEILNFASKIRLTKGRLEDLDLCESDTFSIKRKMTHKDVLNADIILCRTHARRRKLIQQKRFLLGFNSGRYAFHPVPGEKLHVLVNDYKKGLFNGEEVIYEPPYLINGYKKVRVPTEYVFEDLNDPDSYKHANLTFAYATTVHKAQGSEWDNVILTDIENRHPNETPEEYKQWLYTGATRARKRLILA